jgi:hypothetical protein
LVAAAGTGRSAAGKGLLEGPRLAAKGETFDVEKGIQKIGETNWWLQARDIAAFKATGLLRLIGLQAAAACLRRHAPGSG